MKRAFSSFLGPAILLVIAFVVSIILFWTSEPLRTESRDKIKHDKKLTKDLNLKVLIDLGIPLDEISDLTCEQIRTVDIDRETKLPAHIRIRWISDKMYRCNEIG